MYRYAGEVAWLIIEPSALRRQRPGGSAAGSGYDVGPSRHRRGSRDGAGFRILEGRNRLHVSPVQGASVYASPFAMGCWRQGLECQPGGGRAVRVFLSYRRGDVGGYAGRLTDALLQRLGSKNVVHGGTGM